MWKRFGLAAAVMWSGMAQAAVPDGVWSGSYVCAQGETPLELYVTTAPNGVPAALFHFGDGSAERPEGCFSMIGSQTPGALVFTAHAWLLRPPDYVTVNLLGSVAQTRYTGWVSGPGCTSFVLTWHPIAPVPAACRTAGVMTS